MLTVVIGIIIILFAVISTALLYIRYKYQQTSVNEVIRKPIVLKISVPMHNSKKALAAEQMLKSLHGILRASKKSSDHYSFEIVGNSGGIYFIITCDARYRQFLENQIYAQYPDVQIIQIQDYVHAPGTPGHGKKNSGVEISLGKDFYLPIKTFQSFDVDPLASISGAISSLKNGSEVWIQLLARPIADEWQAIGKQFVNDRKNKTDVEGKKVALESGESDELREIEYKNTKSGFQFIIRVIARSSDEITANNLLEDTLASFNQFQTAQFN